MISKVLAQNQDIFLKIRVCGYSSGRPLPEVWEINIRGREAEDPILIQGETSFGPRWDGEYEPLNRLIMGVSDGLAPAVESIGLGDRFGDLFPAVLDRTSGLFYLNAMPVQDAIELARWLVEVTAGFVRFNVDRQPKIVAGSVEIATITKHEDFRWVQRRHFYKSDLNPIL